MSNRAKHYIGITLAFAARENNELILYEDSFLIKTKTFKETLSIADQIGKERSFGRLESRDEFQLYLGIVELFRVVGPRGQGAMLGQTSKFGYKSLGKIQKLVQKGKQYTAFMDNCDASKEGYYIAKLLYFLGPPVPYEDRRALTCMGVVKSNTKDDLVKNTEIVARSARFKNKLFLRGSDCIIPSSFLEFVGVLEIVPIFEKLKAGNTYVGTTKKLRSKREIEKIPLSNTKELKEFFRKKYYQ